MLVDQGRPRGGVPHAGHQLLEARPGGGRAVEHAVRDFLSRETPEIGFFGEEEGATTDTGRGLVWMLDPVDGTANFLHGIPLCGVSLGLVDKDMPTLGVIDLPFLGSRYSAAEGHGA
ncbi:inositol monophosphatase family protein [Streptosporangium roseum]|uniref:inositol monophosphatase family protein n=1 Tax=Streptosporangium roseum TaxID=2001 RepID=UPI003AFB804B